MEQVKCTKGIRPMPFAQALVARVAAALLTAARDAAEGAEGVPAFPYMPDVMPPVLVKTMACRRTGQKSWMMLPGRFARPEDHHQKKLCKALFLTV